MSNSNAMGLTIVVSTQAKPSQDATFSGRELWFFAKKLHLSPCVLMIFDAFLEV